MVRDLAIEINKLADLMKEKEGIISIDINGEWSTNPKSVHMQNESFFDSFGEKFIDLIQERYRLDTEFPYEYSVMIEGVKFFCISKERA